MSLLPVTLDDKYALTEGPIHIAGAQAIVRLAMMQYLRDKHDGRNTASYISGYRGSPMHNIDKELEDSADLKVEDINEDAPMPAVGKVEKITEILPVEDALTVRPWRRFSEGLQSEYHIHGQFDVFL